MKRSGRFHPVLLLAGWAFLACAFSALAAEEDPRTTAQLLVQADAIKTADYAGFLRILAQLRDGRTLLPEQRMFLKYLGAWQLAYEGEYAVAIPQLDEVIADSSDPTLRFRAGVTVVNAHAISAQYQTGYAKLSELLDALPGITDRTARVQGLMVAAMLYNHAGQYDLGLGYSERLLREASAANAACKGGQLKLEALYKSGQLKTVGPEFQAGIENCVSVGEHLYANLIRTYAADIEIRNGRPDEAIALLRSNYEGARRTQFSRLKSVFDALLAEAYWEKGDSSQARQFAQRAVAASVKGEFSTPLVDAYRVLYRVARKQGDLATAVEYQEKFAEADKAYLTEAGAKAMAFQTVRQQVQEKKQQIDALNKRNEVLQLQQKVSTSAAQTRGLLILLLMSVLAFIAMWLYRTKLSQRHFMKLARRDGLTGIFNRSHFADAGEAVLKYCKKGDREACVVIIDLDNFKRVNDRHGHAAGDTVLKRTALACQAHLRSIDIFGRLGGEEFGIVLPDCAPDQALRLTEEFRKGIADISSAGTGVGFPVSASLGVTSTRWSSYNLRQLLMHADSALYVAKHNGRNRVEMFDGSSVAPADPSAPQTADFDRRIAQREGTAT